MKNSGFNEAFAEMISRLTLMENTAVEGLGGAADEVCHLLRIALLKVTLFQSPRDEKQNDGNSLVYYDTRQPLGDVPACFRNVAANRTVAVFQAFPAKDGAPWSEEEQNNIDLVLRTIFQFNSRSNILQIIDRFTYYDPFGFKNLRCFMRHLWDMSEQGRLSGMNSFQLNLKHFGLVNQQIGRKRGDLVMQRFYEGLQALTGEGGLICRLGGDRFIGLAEKQRTPDVLRYLSGTGIVYDDRTNEAVMVSAVVGVFEIPEDFVLTSEADIMDPTVSSAQFAKRSTTTDVVFFSKEMEMQKQHRMEIQQAFVEALEKEDFLVYYQPKVTIESKELSGAEALCRWQRDGCIVPPLKFIPLLEAGMEICKLDFYMLDKVCRDIRRWMDEGRKIVRISVNFSRRHMADLHLVEHIIEIVDRHSVPHEYIEIELTETTTDVEFEYLKHIVSILQKAGFHTSVDDFGIGYSSLKLIEEIPWNVMKVDKSFLPATDESELTRRSVMFRHVISMAQELGLECITEGVETAGQVELLTANHCEMAQGFYFDKPLPVKEFEKRLETIHYAK